MFRYFVRNIPKLIPDVNSMNSYVVFRRFASYVSKEYSGDKDPAPLFFDNEVQSLLKSLTRVDLKKVYRKQKFGEGRLEVPEVKFVTDDELHRLLEEAKKQSDHLLQIPPAVKVRKPIKKVLSEDPALEGLDTSKFVFTDITFGVKNKDRVIVIREPDGILHEADWTLRDRMNQVYFPIKGRKIKIPLMFKDDYLSSLLSRNEYEFILDRACIQFEVDDPDYQRVTSTTYQYINDNNTFDCLRSTRHFGSLVFFLTWFNTIDNLLLELIETSYIQEGNDLLQLYGKVHNLKFEQSKLENIEKFIHENAIKRASLELALQAYKELEKQNTELREGIKKAHGIS